MAGPGLWVKGDASPLDLHPRVLVQDLLDLDLHFCVGAFIVSRHYLHHQHCQGNTNSHSTNKQPTNNHIQSPLLFFCTTDTFLLLKGGSESNGIMPSVALEELFKSRKITGVMSSGFCWLLETANFLTDTLHYMLGTWNLKDVGLSRQKEATELQHDNYRIQH